MLIDFYTVLGLTISIAILSNVAQITPGLGLDGTEALMDLKDEILFYEDEKGLFTEKQFLSKINGRRVFVFIHSDFVVFCAFICLDRQFLLNDQTKKCHIFWTIPCVQHPLCPNLAG